MSPKGASGHKNCNVNGTLCLQSEAYCCEQQKEETAIDLDIEMTMERTMKKKETYGEEVSGLFLYVNLAYP